MTVMGDACAPLASASDVPHVLTREEEKLHMAHGHAKHERRAALGSYDQEETNGTKSGGGFFSRAGKVRRGTRPARRLWADTSPCEQEGLRSLSRVVRAAAARGACGAPDT